MKESWVDKYAPESLEDIEGHPTAVKKLRRWGENWTQGDDPVLLYGPPGTGKSSTAEALANDMGWSMVEINASDSRKKDQMDDVARQMRSSTLDSGKQLFLLDEIDSIDGRSVSSIRKIIKDAPHPVIMTANEKWKVPDSLENASKTHRFRLRDDSIKNVLRKIADIEGADVSSREIGKLGTRDGLRDAINDLQRYAESDEEVGWDERDMEISPFAATRNIIEEKQYTGNVTPPDMVDFLNENVKEQYDGVENMRAYQALAEADKFLAKVDRTQNYSWWKYAGSIVEEVANVRLSEPYDGYVNINYPSSRRQWSKKATGDSDEAHLYREMKEMDKANYRMSINFNEFLNYVLPILKSLPEERKKKLALSESLSSNSMKALDLNPSDYDDWLGGEVERTEDEEGKEDESEEETEETESKGLFDY